MQDKSDSVILAEMNVNLALLREELLGAAGRTGRMQRMEDTLTAHGKRDEELFSKLDQQIAYWRGAIGVVAFCILVFGSVLVTHILRGGK